MSVDPWHFSTLFILGCLALYFTYRTSTSPLVAVIWSYFLSCAIIKGALQTIGEVSPFVLGVQTSALKIALLLVLIPFLFTTAKVRVLDFIFYALATILTLDSVWLITGGEGVFVGNTQDTLILAIFLPFFMGDKYVKWALPAWLVAILMVRGLGSFVVLGVHFLILGAILRRFYYAIPLLLGAVWVYYDGTLRGLRWSTVWKEHLWWWRDHGNPWFGTGPGSFEWISAVGPFSENNRRMWLHSDWLQILFEYGLVGLVLSLAFFFLVSYQLWQMRVARLFSTWICFGVGMLVYSPLQFAPIQVLAGFIVTLSLVPVVNREWSL